MNYYGPLELHDNGEPTGKYHYTRRNDNRVWPLGYCAGKPVTTKEEYEEWTGKNAPDNWNEDTRQVDDALRTIRINRELVDKFGDKYHTDGHDSEEKARQCYTEFCLDVKTAIWSDENTEVMEYHGVHTHGLHEPVEDDNVPADVQARKCGFPNTDAVNCNVMIAYPTAVVGGPSLPNEYYLCSEHCNHEFIRNFWKAPMKSMGSY